MYPPPHLFKSLSPLMEDVAPSWTYFQSFVLIESFQPANHVTYWLCVTSFHLCPCKYMDIYGITL